MDAFFWKCVTICSRHDNSMVSVILGACHAGAHQQSPDRFCHRTHRAKHRRLYWRLPPQSVRSNFARTSATTSIRCVQRP
jgi:hypothetical protein